MTGASPGTRLWREFGPLPAGVQGPRGLGVPDCTGPRGLPDTPRLFGARAGGQEPLNGGSQTTLGLGAGEGDMFPVASLASFSTFDGAPPSAGGVPSCGACRRAPGRPLPASPGPRSRVAIPVLAHASRPAASALRGRVRSPGLDEPWIGVGRRLVSVGGVSHVSPSLSLGPPILHAPQQRRVLPILCHAGRSALA